MDQDTDQNQLASFFRRDPVAAILFGVAILLIVLVFAAVFLARRGNVQFLEGVLVLTMAFAVVGAVFGLVRSLRASRRLRT